MAENQNHQLNPDQIRDLLSPYLDGEVTDEERTLVEQALAVSAELQGELETLQRTVALVAALPPLPAPRPFTLTEADVRGTAPAPKSLFGLPSWVKGWAVLATTLLCVLAAGGLFLNMQFGGVSRQAAAPAAEVANVPPLAATATTAEVQSAAAPTESAAQKEAETAPTDAESMAKTEAATAEEAAPAAEESMADAAEEKTMPATLTAAASPVAALAAPPVGEVAQDAASAGEATTAESQAITATEADQSAPAEGPAEGAVAPTPPAPLPTASPAPQTLTFTAPATEAVEEEAASAAEAENEQAPAQNAAPPAPAEPAGPGLQERGVLPRSIQVENLSLKITPGLIQIEGNIEATPGSILLATLQRNGEPFDNWADPASLQTVVQPNGQFSLIIQASAGRTDQDLFAVEPANYQLTLTSLDGAGPVVAVVPFDTFRLPAEIPSATPSPPASATPVARLTLVPSVATPIATATAIATSLPEDVSPNTSGWLIGAGLAALVVIIGLIVWLIRNNKN